MRAYAMGAPQVERRDQLNEMNELLEADGARSVVEMNGAFYTNITNEFARYLGVGKGDNVSVAYNHGAPIVVDEECIVIRRADDE